MGQINRYLKKKNIESKVVSPLNSWSIPHSVHGRIDVIQLDSRAVTWIRKIRGVSSNIAVWKGPKFRSEKALPPLFVWETHGRLTSFLGFTQTQKSYIHWWYVNLSSYKNFFKFIIGQQFENFSISWGVFGTLLNIYDKAHHRCLIGS